MFSHACHPQPKHFRFDSVLGPDASQQQVFEGAPPAPRTPPSPSSPLTAD